MFEVGQKVWDVIEGEGFVYDIDNYISYPVAVEFLSGKRNDYTINGMDLEVQSIPSLYPYPVDIVKKIVKPSISWEHVRDEYKFLARDANGDAWLYWEKPEIRGVEWGETRGVSAEANSYASYTPGTCNWKDSLVARPKDV